MFFVPLRHIYKGHDGMVPKESSCLAFEGIPSLNVIVFALL